MNKFLERRKKQIWTEIQGKYLKEKSSELKQALEVDCEDDRLLEILNIKKKPQPKDTPDGAA